ncbi:MAG: RsmE family RNA methyltransferase [Sandaracinus sp.]
MTERRFRVEALGEVGERVPLADAAARHASVLRLRAGDEVVLFDGRGGEALASLEDEAGELSGRLLERRQAREPWHVVLIVGMPKASALEELLRGATEAGASEVRLFGAARSVVRLDELRAPKKLERWRRILDEASRQSERAIVPALSIHTSLAQAIAVLPEKCARRGARRARGQGSRRGAGRGCARARDRDRPRGRARRRGARGARGARRCTRARAPARAAGRDRGRGGDGPRGDGVLTRLALTRSRRLADAARSVRGARCAWGHVDEWSRHGDGTRLRLR